MRCTSSCYSNKQVGDTRLVVSNIRLSSRILKIPNLDKKGILLLNSFDIPNLDKKGILILLNSFDITRGKSGEVITIVQAQ